MKNNIPEDEEFRAWWAFEAPDDMKIGDWPIAYEGWKAARAKLTKPKQDVLVDAAYEVIAAYQSRFYSLSGTPNYNGPIDEEMKKLQNVLSEE